MGKKMMRKRETWRRRVKVKGCERPEEVGPAARGKISRYWRRHGVFGSPRAPLEILPLATDGWSQQTLGYWPLGAWALLMLKELN